MGKEGSLREKIERYAQPFIPHRIILITVARFLTPVFNPVNFFYLLNEENEPEQMLIEVNNTFRQRHVYMTASTRKYPIQTQFKKEFHVSPFNDMSGEYEATFSPPDENLRISIKLMHEERCILDTALWGQGEPLSTRSLWKHIARHPFSAALTLPRIYYQAAQLHWRKNYPFSHTFTHSSTYLLENLMKPNWLEKCCMKLVDRQLQSIETGKLILTLPDHSEHSYGDESATTTQHIQVNEYAFFVHIVFAGNIGLGEAYTDQLWETSDLAGLLSLFIYNMDSLKKAGSPVAG